MRRLMAQLTHAQYDALERAVVDGTRIAIRRRGRREHIVIPLRLGTQGRPRGDRGAQSDHRPRLEIDLDDIDRIEVVR